MNINDSIKSIYNYKFELLINSSLYKDSIITKEIYERVENNLLDKINILSKEMEYI